MPFADLTDVEQADRVREALKALLGDTPTIPDYLALAGATDAVIDELKQSLFRKPLRSWLPDAPIAA